MEKKLLLAAFLSFMVVYFWSNSLRIDQNEVKNSNVDKLPVKEEVTKKQIEVDSSEQIIQSLKQEKDEKVKSKKYVVENDKLEVNFSNIGGVVKSIFLKEYSTSLPIKNILAIKGFENKAFQMVSSSDNQIIYSLETETFKIIKQFILSDNDYNLKAKITVKNKTTMSKETKIDVQSYLIDMSSLDIANTKKDKNSIRSKSLLEYVVFADKKMYRKNNAFKFKDKELKKSNSVVDWVGFRNRYFCYIIKPEYKTTGYIINPLSSKSLNIIMKSKEVNMPELESINFAYNIYYGPEKLTLLKQYKENFELIKRYYKNGLLDGLAKAMNSILYFLHKIVPVWGICIILMSIIVYFSMYPLTVRGMLSMKKMQSLQPEISKIKEKYKNDQQKANMEVMELYKKHKINPLGGCLPMFLQMPVFIGLYQVLWRSVYFNGASFLWIKDLSKPDRLFKLPITIPVVNSEYFNLLPLLMMIIMFFQQKLSAKNMVSSDPAQQSQQKMMSTIMPLFLGFIFYTFASGLTLYFTMFYLFSSFTQWKMSKQGKVKA